MLNTLTDAPQFAARWSWPVIPVALHLEAEKWKKQPLASWEAATLDEELIAGWWRVWPDAFPAIPLKLTDLVVVDADTPEAVAEMKALRMLGPHSRIDTPSGGFHMVFAQPPERIGRFRWSEGVEILGTSSLLIVYDVETLKFPRVAPRAVLPEVFWKPRQTGLSSEEKEEGATTRYPRIKRRAGRDAAVVGDLTAALWEMDPVDWRGDYDGWFHLAGACQAAGISENEFVRWSLGDPVYAADERAIRRICASAHARHSGALYKALAERGITVGKGPALYPEVPCRQPSQRQTTRNLQDRTRCLIGWFVQSPGEQRLFDVACSFAEIVAEGRLKIENAHRLLWNNLAKFRKEIGDAEFQRTVANAFRHVEEKVLQ
jgi:Bifunctional DNA primase/polymerase, N-terminal